MIYIEEMKKVANKHLVNLYETSNHTMIFELPEIHGIKPLLLTVDNGEGWNVEAMGAQGKMWSGHPSQKGAWLDKEIRLMYQELQLGNPAMMLSVAQDIQSEMLGKLFH